MCSREIKRNKERETILNKIVYVNLDLIQFVNFFSLSRQFIASTECLIQKYQILRDCEILKRTIIRAFSAHSQYFLRVCIVHLFNRTYAYIFLRIYARVLLRQVLLRYTISALPCTDCHVSRERFIFQRKHSWKHTLRGG